MIIAENCFNNCINAPVRNPKARVELYNGSTLVRVFKCVDNLKEFTVERVGDESKFFGFGICQRLNVKLIDKERAIDISTANTLEAVFGTGCDYVYTNPLFYVSEVRRNENTNELSITAYDAIDKAASHTVEELGLYTPYTTLSFLKACAAFLGLPLKLEGLTETDSSLAILYEQGANFEGTETIREALDALAEVTQTIYFSNHNWELVFKRLDISGQEQLTITKDKYFKLESKSNRRLSGICHATELGDNVSAALAESGTTQYIRNNPFWDMREDIATLVDNALATAGGLTINQFSCSWRGNYLLEIGDKIALITKDNEKVFSYVFNDAITYDGGINQETQWNYESGEETESNPTSLGDALKQTYARVDKANKEITLLASDIQSQEQRVSSLEINTDYINMAVSNIEKSTNEQIGNINNDISTLTTKVEATMTAEEARLEIQRIVNETGTTAVETTTGFTFNQDGLTVSKSDSEISTKITEDGMTVTKGDTEVLTANNEGVKAIDLHAETFLIVGTNSRFENYGSGRTGCFWIGG